MSSDPTATPPPDPPKSFFEKAGAALPIALTAIATAFAGMSTSELQRAMFWRSYAAQDQAKATSQWTLAGFKRDRSLICQVAAAQLRATAGNPPNPFAGSNGEPNSPAAWLAGDGPPPAKLPEVADEALKKLLADIQARAPEAEQLRQAGRVPQATINAAINDAEKAVEQLDREWEPTIKAAGKLAAGDKTPLPAAQAAGYELEQRRYRIEAGLNQGVGYLYEARVKVSAAESDRHQDKSRKFFYAMLAAQIGATISSLALARKQQSVLWAVAGGSGLVALVIGAYVYLSA
ncbi:MAG: hypothetical protein U0871_20260 [Gemmataceae bacterium]